MKGALWLGGGACGTLCHDVAEYASDHAQIDVQGSLLCFASFDFL